MIAILRHVKITARAKTPLPCTLVTVCRATAAAIAKQVQIYTSHTYIHPQMVYQNLLKSFVTHYRNNTVTVYVNLKQVTLA